MKKKKYDGRSVNSAGKSLDFGPNLLAIIKFQIF